MPELPDITLYVEKLEQFVLGQRLRQIRFMSAFVLRSTEPPVDQANGKRVIGVKRIGKQVVVSLESELHLVMHLMISGRLRWRKLGSKPAKSMGLAVFEFTNGCVHFTEASKRKRASLHLVSGKEALSSFDRGGLEIASADEQSFHRALSRENHTLKRALTDQRILSGIGNAYSDEILHHAQMSPSTRTASLTQQQSAQLLRSCQTVLKQWTERLRLQCGEKFPDKVTAFHEEMAVHGRYNLPCPRCGAPVQRIVYANNESNYCAACQTKGKLLADRSLSRLLKSNWPKTLEELEAR